MARSESQKEADKRYAKKRDESIIGFHCKKAEAAYIESVIKESGYSKIDFLRMSVKKYLENNKKD